MATMIFSRWSRYCRKPWILGRCSIALLPVKTVFGWYPGGGAPEQAMPASSGSCPAVAECRQVDCWRTFAESEVCEALPVLACRRRPRQATGNADPGVRLTGQAAATTFARALMAMTTCTVSNKHIAHSHRVYIGGAPEVIRASVAVCGEVAGIGYRLRAQGSAAAPADRAARNRRAPGPRIDRR